VPAAPPVEDAPRLEGARLRTAGAWATVVERDDGSRAHRAPQRLERRLTGGEAGFEDRQRGGVDVGTVSGELEDGVGRCLGEARVLPDAGRQTEHGRLLGGEPQRRQLELAAPD